MSDSGHRGTRRAIGVPRERTPGETRVALLPSEVEGLVHDGLDVLVETGAGDGVGATDDAYRTAGAQIVDAIDALHDRADIVARVRVPASHDEVGESALLHQGQTLIGLLEPHRHPDLMADLAGRGVDAFSLDAVPPGIAGLTVDAAASQGAVAGYQAALLAATALGRRFGHSTTPSGSLPAARVLVVGGGVVAMHAAATARRLGAEVSALFTTDAGRDLIASLGVSVVDAGTDVAEALMHGAGEADVVICAETGGGTMLTADAVRGMAPGSVVIDLGTVPGRPGGFCALSRPDETVTEDGVTIIAPTHAARLAPVEASQYLSHNVHAFIAMLVAVGSADVLEQAVLAGTAIVVGGEVLHGPTRAALGLPALEPRHEAPDDDPTDDRDTQVVGDDDAVIALGEPTDAPDTTSRPVDASSVPPAADDTLRIEGDERPEPDDVIAVGEPDPAPDAPTDPSGEPPAADDSHRIEGDEQPEPLPEEPVEDAPPRWSFLLEDAPERESGDDRGSADDPADPSAWWTSEPSEPVRPAPPDDPPAPDDRQTAPYRPASPTADTAWWMRDDTPVDPAPVPAAPPEPPDAGADVPPVDDGVRWDATDDDSPAPDATARHDAVPGDPRRERRWPFGPRDRRDDEPGGTS